MVYSNFILLIKPHDQWQLYVPTIYHAQEHEFYFRTKGKVELEEVEQDKAFRKLISLCSACEPKALYESFGKKGFRKADDFWAKADKQLQDCVKQVMDKRLVDIVKAASQLGIHLFFRKIGKEELLKKNELFLSALDIVPLMIFRKGDEGIEYRLHLRLNKDEIIVPSEHTLVLFAESPGMLSIDSQLYLLPDDFSGKQLLPFLQKPSTFIPQRMQNEYFHRFILKNTYKREIQAEGFDIVEACTERKCRLSLEKNVYGESLFTVAFIYDEATFLSTEKRQLSVRLEEEEGGFRFVKVIRDKTWETALLERLRSEWQMPGKGTLASHIGWLKEQAESLKQAGVEFRQPSARKYYIGDAKICQSTNWNNDWFQMHIEIHLDDGKVIPFLKLKDAILHGEQELLLEDGSVFLIPEVWFARYTGVATFGRVEGKNLLLHRSQMPVIAVVSGEESSRQPVESSLPNGLKADLRHYQQAGFEWLYHHFISRTGCCLSDDMGLGKTIQTIALLLKYKETCPKLKSTPKSDASLNLFSDNEMIGETALAVDSVEIPYETVLVVSPASLVYNWRNELHRFAPQLLVNEYIGTMDERKQKRQALTTWDVVLTTYQTLRNDIEQLSRFTFGMVVFDESQCFKNRSSYLYQAVIRLQARHRLALSGTPIENSLSDLWSLMNVLNPPLLGDYRAFQENYIHPISRDIQHQKAEVLRMLVSPYFLKRAKEEVLSDLPARQDELVFCEMTPEQQLLYDEELSSMRNQLLASETGESSDSVNVLNAITRLRQIACHPSLANEDCTSSGKFTEIFSRLEELYATEHKVLIFSEYVKLLKLVGEEMKQRNWTYELLTGDTHNREAVINSFMERPTCHFFLISLKAGGVGLNLTSADYVFLLDPWWNRAAEEQAISRAHRMGQQRSVFVYRFISKGTLEEQILDLQDRKQSLIDAVLPFIKKK